MKITVLHNPTAGYDQPEKEEIFSELKKWGYDEITYRSTKEDAYKEALNNLADLLIIAGGDGTVGKIAKHLPHFEIPIGLLPLGTANNIAKTFNLCKKPSELIKNINFFPKRAFNIGIAEGAWGKKQFLESVGFGLFAYVITECKKVIKGIDDDFDSRNEEISMNLNMLKEVIQTYEPHYYKIDIDGQDYSGNYLLIEVMNIKYIGPNLNMAKNADPGDDYFDVVFIKDEDRHSFLNYVNKKLQGEADHVDFNTVKGQKIKVISENKDLHIDDHVKDLQEGSEIEIDFAPYKLKMLAPEI